MMLRVETILSRRKAIMSLSNSAYDYLLLWIKESVHMVLLIQPLATRIFENESISQLKYYAYFITHWRIYVLLFMYYVTPDRYISFFKC